MDEAPPQTLLLAELDALLSGIEGMPTDRPEDAETTLRSRVPADGSVARRVEALASTGAREGWLLPRSAGPNVSYGRLSKDLRGFSVDAVLMEGPAAGHTHVNGEVNLCFRWSGDPRFDGRPPGWVVFPPGSHHVPTVTGGRMLILYFVPGGRVLWDPPPAPAARA